MSLKIFSKIATKAGLIGVHVSLCRLAGTQLGQLEQSESRQSGAWLARQLGRPFSFILDGEGLKVEGFV